MHSYIYRIIILLVIVHNAQSRIYVVDLSSKGAHKSLNHDNNLSLQELLLLLNPIQNQKPHGNVHKKAIPFDLEKCFLFNSKTKLLECLSEMNRRDKTSVGRDSLFYPEYFKDFYAQRPKRTIYPLFDPYGRLLEVKQPFADLTRQEEFSQDYLDVGDLSRLEMCKTAGCNQRRVRNQHRPNIIHSRRQDSDSDSVSDSSGSDVDRGRKRKPSRFQVVFEDEPSSESEEREKKRPEIQSSFESDNEMKKEVLHSDESIETEKENKKSLNSDSSLESSLEQPIKIKGKYSYIQGNKIYDSLRRRLTHFLPKRFRWSEDDLHHLGYYWFNGPRGESD